MTFDFLVPLGLILMLFFNEFYVSENLSKKIKLASSISAFIEAERLIFISEKTRTCLTGEVD